MFLLASFRVQLELLQCHNGNPCPCPHHHIHQPTLHSKRYHQCCGDLGQQKEAVGTFHWCLSLESFSVVLTRPLPVWMCHLPQLLESKQNVSPCFCHMMNCYRYTELRFNWNCKVILVKNLSKISWRRKMKIYPNSQKNTHITLCYYGHIKYINCNWKLRTYCNNFCSHVFKLSSEFIVDKIDVIIFTLKLTCTLTPSYNILYWAHKWIFHVHIPYPSHSLSLYLDLSSLSLSQNFYYH